jgi:hypothetical protein
MAVSADRLRREAHEATRPPTREYCRYVGVEDGSAERFPYPTAHGTVLAHAPPHVSAARPCEPRQ